MSFTILGNPRRRVITPIALTVVAALPFISAQALGDPFEAPRALAAALAALAVLATASGGVRGERRLRIAGLVLATLVGWYLLAAALGEPASSLWGVMGRFQGLTSFVLLVVLGSAGVHLRGREPLRLAWSLGTVSAVLAVVVLVQAVGGTAPQAWFGNPTIAGAWLAVASGVVFAAALASPAGRGRMLLWGAAALGAAAAGATASQAAVLAVLAAGAAVLLAARRVPGRAVAAVALVAVATIGLGIGIGTSFVTGTFEPGELVGGSARSRIEIWRGTLAMIGDNPFVGVGPGRFIYEFPAYQTAEHVALEGADVRPDQAHSHLLQYAAEGGVPAAVLWATLCALAIAAAWKAARGGNGAALIALGGLVAYLTHAAFGVAAIETDAIGWLLAGVALAAGGTRPAAAVSPSSPARRALAIGVSALLVTLIGWYVVANAFFGRGVDHFISGDMGTSLRELERAVGIDPMTDIYRVALADTASYMDESARRDALEVLERGLELEPHSYDLALSRARMLANLDRPAGEIADAYAEALARFPLGVTVGREAVVAFEAAGRAADARRERALLDVLGYGVRDPQ